MRTVKYNLRNLLLLLLCGLSFVTANGQVSKSKKKTATVAPVVTHTAKTGLRPYNEVISKGFVTYGGLFTVHKKKDTTYFEIPDTIMRRDIMVIIHFKSSSRGTEGYPGMDLDNTVIQFNIGPDSTISIKQDLVISEADTTSNIYKAVKNSETNPVINSFPIVACNKVKRICN